MNWSDGANLYLLQSVSEYGKNWSLVSSALSVIANTFLKHDKLKDFSDKVSLHTLVTPFPRIELFSSVQVHN